MKHKPANSTLDTWYRKAIHKRWHGECVFFTQSECEGGLEVHHMVHRRQLSTRWLLENGFLVCTKHHETADLPASNAYLWAILGPAARKVLDKLAAVRNIKDMLQELRFTQNEWREMKLHELKAYCE